MALTEIQIHTIEGTIAADPSQVPLREGDMIAFHVTDDSDAIIYLGGAASIFSPNPGASLRPNGARLTVGGVEARAYCVLLQSADQPAPASVECDKKSVSPALFIVSAGSDASPEQDPPVVP